MIGGATEPALSQGGPCRSASRSSRSSGLRAGTAVHDVPFDGPQGRDPRHRRPGRRRPHRDRLDHLRRPRPDGGEIKLHREAGRSRVRPATQRTSGFALVPRTVATRASSPTSRCAKTSLCPALSRLSRLGLIRRRRRRRAGAHELVERLAIMPPNLRQRRPGTSRAATSRRSSSAAGSPATAQVYIFDEPTTGVDVGSKVEIYRQMTRAGARTAPPSSSSPRTPKSCSGMCDRIVVMKKGAW